jgi:hypothetical protein
VAKALAPRAAGPRVARFFSMPTRARSLLLASSMRPTHAFAVAWIGALATAMGCGSSVPLPTDQWAAAQANVGRAQGGGAPYVPDANLHLQLAMEDLQRCRQLLGKNNGRARSLCALASSEAELALNLAVQAAAQRDALQAQADLQKATGR